jgi:hypothetical protein
MNRLLVLIILILTVFISSKSAFAIDFTQVEIAGDTGWTWGVDSGDIDTDGDNDIVVANFSGGNKLWLNDGDANFTAHTVAGFGAGSSVTMTDLNQDGHQDILVSRVGGSSLVAYMNDGALNFTTQVIHAGTAALYGSVVADIDDDGDLDIYVTERESTRSNLLYINNGANIFTQSNIPGDMGSTITAKIADIDDDGDLDIYAPRWTGIQNKLWINDGLGNGGASFTASDITGDTADAYSTQVVDIDDDGDLDIHTGATLAQNKLWINDGLGNGGASFTASDIVGDVELSAGLAFDVDDDDDIDIYTARYGFQSYFWINDGLGNGGASFIDDPIDSDSFNVIGSTTNDFDGDGYLDIYLGIYEGGQNKLWINDFVPPPAPEPESSSSSSSGSIRYVCKNTLASNYNSTRFARHKESMCKFDGNKAAEQTVEATPDTKNENVERDALCSVPFNSYYELGDSDSNVSKIQSFLRDHLKIETVVDGIFGRQTKGLVSLFQNKYSDDILKPWNLSQGTGRWYQSTRKKANEILGCPESSVTLDNGVFLK